MDSDDMCCVTRIQKQVDFMESRREVDVVGCGTCYLDKNDVPVGHRYARPSHYEICSQPGRTFGLCHGSVLCRKKWFEENQYDESIPIAVDFDIWLRTYQHSTFANIPEPLYYYRLDNSFNLSKQFAARYFSANFLFEHFAKTGRLDRAIANWLVQYGKFAITIFVFVLGLRYKLTARRFQRLSFQEAERYSKEISKIKSISLPLHSVE
jgi:hypothetical protein